MNIFWWRHTLLLTGLVCSLYTPALTAQGDKAAPVTTIIVQEQDIQRVLNLTGTVTAAQAARLSVATSGLVTSMHVDAGSKVQAGELLLELDPELAQLQLDSAKAQVEQAHTALKDARRLERSRMFGRQTTQVADTGRAIALTNRGVLHAVTGEKDKARLMFEMALMLKSKEESARTNLRFLDRDTAVKDS